MGVQSPSTLPTQATPLSRVGVGRVIIDPWHFVTVL